MLKKAYFPVAILIATLLSGAFSTYAGNTPSSSGTNTSLTITSGDASSGSALSDNLAPKNQIHVEATPKSGTFRDVMLITLTADNPKAQIWYVTSSDASPGDALRYRKPIRVTQSMPIYFFAYVDEQSESKIEKEEYIIVSSSGATASGASLGNTKSGAISGSGLSGDIAEVLKKPTKKPVAVKPPVKKPIATNNTASGKTIAFTGNLTTAITNTGANASGAEIPPKKETIESLYKEQTPLAGTEIKKILQDSKSSGFESMDTKTKWVAATGLLSILIAIGVTRFVRSRKNKV